MRKENSPNWSRHLWWILALAGMITLILWLRPSAGFQFNWMTILLGAALIAFLVNFPIPVAETKASLAHAISLPLGIALGPGTAGLALLIGMVFGELIHVLWQRRVADPPLGILLQIKTGASSFSRQVLSLSGAMAVYLLLGGRFLIDSKSLPLTLPALGLVLSFSALFLALHWLDRRALSINRIDRREHFILVLVALVPIPFAILSAATYAFLQEVTLVIYGVIIATVSPIVRNLTVAERDLKRRVQELSTISRVSQAMPTSLDLEALLRTIYSQVTDLLQLNNFYIALHNPDDDLISYPLAVINGTQQDWSSRLIADCLSDRVIRTGEPILIPREALRVLSEADLAHKHTPPQAWLGVPLLASDRTIGCLIVFHTNPSGILTQKDLDVIATLAGQASVAIENALLYEQTRNRAQALTLLNEITASMSSTLDPERALELVCLSMIRVGGGQKSAIFLFDRDFRHLFLARAINLSAEFTQAWKTIHQEDRERIQAYHSETPVLVPDVSISKLSQPIIEQMHAEGIYAFADFPLITPSGTIGQLSVYFSEPQRFRTDQVDMLKTFAAQAALAVANSRAHAETDQALRRRVDQLATLDAVGREMTAMLNTDELFEVILTHALNVPKTTTGHLSIYEPEADGLRIVAHRGYPTDSPVTDPDKIHPTNLGVLGRVYQSAEICNVPEVLQDPDYTDWCGGVTRSLLAIPIIRQGRVLGVITIEASTPGAFTVDHEYLLAQIAQQAAVALTNATLYQQIETHFREQSLLYQASTQIASSYESKAVALAVVDSIAVALSADGAHVSRWDPVSRTLISQAAIQDGKPINGPSHATITINDVPALATCLEERKTLQWSLKDAPSAADHRYLAEFRQAGALLAVPLIVGDQTLGLIEVFNYAERSFNENAIRSAQTIAIQAAIALENTDLFRRIRESQTLLMAVLNSTQEGMLMVDTQGKIVLANHQLEKLTRLSVAELIGSNLSEEKLHIADHLGYQSDELANILTTLRSRQPLQWGISTFEVEYPSRRTFQRSEAPVHDASDQLIGWLVVLRDISEERELSQTREQLTEMIVHDLRSPLTTILGSLKLLDKEQADDDTSPVVKQALSISNRSVQQMLGLVNSLLDIAKLESGELTLSLQSLSLDVLCEELVEAYVHEANEGGIILNLNLVDGLPKITADEEKLRRVLANLLDNALKFTPAGGRVDLDVESEGEEVIITVTDTGPGVPEEFRERIFKRFDQVPGIAGRRRGTGLGLAFSKLAVAAHGGRIWVEDNPGGGSAFRIQLPLHP